MVVSRDRSSQTTLSYLYLPTEITEYLWVKIYQPSCQVARLHPRRFLNGENAADLGIHDLPRRINGFSLVVPRVC